MGASNWLFSSSLRCINILKQWHRHVVTEGVQGSQHTQMPADHSASVTDLHGLSPLGLLQLCHHIIHHLWDLAFVL